jgi:hypothetical protein
MTSPLEYRVARFQELLTYGKYYRIMNWNLGLLVWCFRKGRGKFSKPTMLDIMRHEENFSFY